MTTDLEPLIARLAENDAEVVRYYRLATQLLVGGLLLHLLFASWFVWRMEQVSDSRVLLFAIFNVSALVVELFLSRIAFMLGSRGGQLRDLQYALLVAASGLDTARFETAARAIMATRRDTSTLKILDLEAILAKAAGEKPGKGAA